MKVAVIGGGIVGLTTAYSLIQHNIKDVTVIEAESYVAMKCSYANGGQISVSNSETWNSWDMVSRGLKWLGKKDAPFLIRPSLDWDKIEWLAKFIGVIVRGEQAENTAKTIKMGLESRRLYEAMINKENIEFDREFDGILHIYKNHDYLNKAVKSLSMFENNGLRRTSMDPKSVNYLVPYMNKDKMLGGIFTPSDWTGDIHKFCNSLTDVLKLNKVQFRMDTQISAEQAVDEYDYVIVCNGVGATEFTKELGDKQLVLPVKGYSITVNIPQDQLYMVPRVSLLDDEAKIVTSRIGNRFRIAGTAELAGHNYDIRQDRIKPLLDWTHRMFPQLNLSDYSAYACLRPMTPNMLPIVKQSKYPTVFYNFGHGHLGWTLAPATAEEVVKLFLSHV